jgi:hypothetical protein
VLAGGGGTWCAECVVVIVVCVGEKTVSVCGSKIEVCLGGKLGCVWEEGCGFCWRRKIIL